MTNTYTYTIEPHGRPGDLYAAEYHRGTLARRYGPLTYAQAERLEHDPDGIRDLLENPPAPITTEV